jgi:hypothetical protein
VEGECVGNKTVDGNPLSNGQSWCNNVVKSFGAPGQEEYNKVNYSLDKLLEVTPSGFKLGERLLCKGDDPTIYP